MNVFKSFQAILLIGASLCLSGMANAQNPIPKDSLDKAKSLTAKALKIWNSTPKEPKAEREEIFNTQIIPMLHQAAEMGRPAAMVNLGTAYFFGMGGSPDHKQGAMWWRKGWENGYYDIYDKLTQFGGYNDSDLIDWLIESADNGNSEAQLTLGLIYEVGAKPASGEDKEKAIKYYTLAAENGQPTAMRSLGFIYMYDNGTGIRDEKGKPWLEKAAAAGDADAMYYLGEWYLNEGGDGKDQSKAVEWFQKAARNGNKKAQDMLLEKGYSY